MSNEIKETTPINILVIDGSSGLGQAVVKTLASAGHKVIATTTDTAGGHAIRNNGGLPTFADISRKGEIVSNIKGFEVDVVINLAPQVGNQIPLVNNHWDIADIRAQTEAVLEACKETEIKFLVQTSYAYIYGDQDGATVTEATKPNRDDDNPTIKTALAIEKSVLKSDVPAAILRLGYVYGAESTGVNQLAQQLLSGTPVVSTKAVLNWIHVEDAAEAIRRTIEAQPVGEIFNVVDDHPASSEAFLQAFCSAYGLQQPNHILDFFARGRLNKAQQTLMKYSVVCSHDKITQALGWNPVYKTQTDGIERLLLSWRAREAANS